MILKYLGVVLLLATVSAKPANDEEGKCQEINHENITIRLKLLRHVGPMKVPCVSNGDQLHCSWLIVLISYNDKHHPYHLKYLPMMNMFKCHF